MPSRARAPARTVSGSHFPPKGSVYVEAPGVRSRGPPRAPQKSVKKAATAVNMLFDGTNVGKLIVKIADPATV